MILVFNPLVLDPAEWSHTLKQLVFSSRRISGECLTVLLGQGVNS